MENSLWVKTIYFNCFDTWLKIEDNKNRGPELFKILNLDAKKIRNQLLMTEISLRDTINDRAPYIFTSESAQHKLQAVYNAEDAIKAEIASVVLKPGAAETMQELKRRWYGIGIISNLSKDYVSVVNDKREIVMIGDHYNNDYKAPIDYGINAIHMDRSKTNKAPRGQRVYSMEELLEIFR